MVGGTIDGLLGGSFFRNEMETVLINAFTLSHERVNPGGTLEN